MYHSSSQAFLRELDKKLWTAVGKRGGGLHQPSPPEYSQSLMALKSRLLAIRGIAFAKEHAEAFTQIQHSDLRAVFVMALPCAEGRSIPRSHHLRLQRFEMRYIWSAEDLLLSLEYAPTGVLGRRVGM